MKNIRDRHVLNRQIGIAVKDEKFFTELRQGAFDRATSAEQFFAVKRIIKPDAERFATKIALNHFAKIADT